jgi:chromosome partitioning protein
MLISFANQKGGCGKSSIALLLGAYLAKTQNKKVVGIDTDKQRSYLGRYDKDKSLSENPLYEVMYYEPLELVQLIREKKLDEDTYYIIDTPNQLSKETLAVFVLSDKLIVPYNYSKVSMESTSTFMSVISKVCSNANDKLLFIANNIIAQAKKETIEKYQSILADETAEDCVIKNMISASINVQRMDSLNVSGTLLDSNSEVLNEIMGKLGK